MCTFQSCKSPASYRFWRGLYNRFDRGMHPRQSVEDYLSAIQEETQQLEEQLASHKQVGQGYTFILLIICHKKLFFLVIEDDYSSCLTLSIENC